MLPWKLYCFSSPSHLSSLFHISALDFFPAENTTANLQSQKSYYVGVVLLGPLLHKSLTNFSFPLCILFTKRRTRTWCIAGCGIWVCYYWESKIWSQKTYIENIIVNSTPWNTSYKEVLLHPCTILVSYKEIQDDNIFKPEGKNCRIIVIDLSLEKKLISLMLFFFKQGIWFQLQIKLLGWQCL